MPATMKLDWNSSQVEEQAISAQKRAVAKLADAAAQAAKQYATVVTGTLRNSIHSAESGYDGDDFVRPRQGQALIDDLQVDGELGEADEYVIGSWVPYAELENEKTEFLQQGLDSVIDQYEEFLREEYAL